MDGGGRRRRRRRQRGETDRAGATENNTHRRKGTIYYLGTNSIFDQTSRVCERYAAGLPRKASHHASPQAAAGQVPVGEWHDARAIALCTSLAILS